MKERLKFNITHGLFDTRYDFVIKQETRLTPNCYGKSNSIVTIAEVYNNDTFVSSSIVVKHKNDENQDKYAFYAALDKLTFSQFPVKSIRKKIYDSFATAYKAYCRESEEVI